MLCIFAVLGIVMMIVSYFMDKSDRFNWSPIVIFILGLLMFFGSAITAIVLLNDDYDETVQTAEYQLVAFDDDGQMAYHISMDDGEGYLFRYQDNDDIKYVTVQSTNTKISEVDVTNAVLREYTVYTKLKISDNASRVWLFRSNTTESKRYEAFVPKGSIIDAYPPQASK